MARRACELTGAGHADYLNTLAVAYAGVENLGEAVKVSQKALGLAQATGNKSLISKLRKQLEVIKRALAGSKD